MIKKVGCGGCLVQGFILFIVVGSIHWGATSLWDKLEGSKVRNNVEEFTNEWFGAEEDSTTVEVNNDNS